MAGLLGMLGASARNLGQVGKNYGRIAKGRGADLLKSNPEYAIGAGLAGVAGGSIAHGIGESNEKRKVHQYQALRQMIKKETDGLGGLVYNKKKDEYVVTYAGSPTELTSNKHFHPLKFIIDSTNDKLDIKMSTSIHSMSDKTSKDFRKKAEQMMKTPEGMNKIQDWMDSRQMQNPYSDDYGKGKDPFGFGTER
tara:strand:- start:191 stop:772 length:582 start_codon:yes stop_codon:yes gene_type:complete